MLLMENTIVMLSDMYICQLIGMEYVQVKQKTLLYQKECIECEQNCYTSLFLTEFYMFYTFILFVSREQQHQVKCFVL